MAKQPITFDQLPTLVVELSDKVDNLTRLLQTIQETGAITHVGDEPAIDIDLAASVLGIAKQTIYQRIKDLPHKRRFGRLYFFRSELLDYLRKGDVAA
jgi:predicted DNA-binding transcriptional regulator AlpA